MSATRQHKAKYRHGSGKDGGLQSPSSYTVSPQQETHIKDELCFDTDLYKIIINN
jgi:hypothetical protein